MYEQLTAFIEPLKKEIDAGTFGELVQGKKEDGVFHLPYYRYSDTVHGLEKAIYAFADQHPEFDLHHYDRVLKEGGVSWPLDQADVSTLSGKTIAAMILATFRAERFSEGNVWFVCRDGLILRWLSRLQELDAQSGR